LYGQNAFQAQASGKPVSELAPVRDIAAHVAAASETPRKRSLASWVLLLLVRMYVIFLSPFLGGACKFYPSCSNYAREAIERHGARRGVVLALKRLVRCHPFTPGGIDFVPDELPDRSRALHAHLAAGGQGRSR
jgi:putative membrane protein insertion efficiency factor